MSYNETSYSNPNYNYDYEIDEQNETRKVGDWIQPFQTDYLNETYYDNKNDISVTLSWIISTYVEEKQSLISKIKDKIYGVQDDENRYKKILDNVVGVVKPGQLVAIMGASGAGKTTLLNTLNFRNKGKMDIESDIRINGRPIHSDEISGISGYVQQNDVFSGTLTVREWLSFQAHLRMGLDYNEEEINRRIDEVIIQVNLVKAQYNFIGMGDKMKGISGGEKRRLAFATQIITNPPLLFCDEPTSGLDAYMAIGLVEIMEDLARIGKTIVCTIHQPSTQIFEKFDTLCLLSEGRIAYLGPRIEATNFFGSDIISSLGYNCPRNYNPADFFIQILAISPNEREDALIRSKEICDAFQGSIYQKNIEESISILHKSNNDSSHISFDKSYSSTTFQQIKWLLWRNFITDIRTPISTYILAIQVIFISIFFGLIYLDIKLDEIGVMNTNGLLFILLMNAGFIFLFPILNVFAAEIQIFKRDTKDNLYATWVYYVSKQIAEFPKYFILGFILITIIYWIADVRNDAGVYISITLTFLLLIQCSNGFAYFLSALSGSVEVGSAIAAPILIPLILFAGFFLSNNSTPVYFIWIKYISWFYYTYDAVLIVLWNDYQNIPCSTPKLTNGCDNPRCFKNGDAVLSTYSVDENNLGRNIGLLFVIDFALRLLGFLFLKLRAKRL